MATAKQIQMRLGQAKKKLTKLGKEVTATKSNIKKLETQLKSAKAAAKAKPKPKAKRKKAPAKRKRKAAARTRRK